MTSIRMLSTMIRRATFALLAVVLIALALASSAAAQSATRAIRRDIPMTDAIERALRAGSRDSTGSPTSRYWQLEVDYTIEAHLETWNSTLYGCESVVIRNTSPQPLTAIGLRLDQNIFRPGAIRLQPPAETT